MKTQKERFKTYNDVFDEFTLRNIFRLSSQGYFEELHSPIAIGKESNVFSAIKKDKSLVAVKIYRLETCDFTRMYEYIRFDPRYVGLKNKRRKIIFAWTQREYRNLLKAREYNVKVPTPLTFLSNILVIEFIGRKEPAKKLKDHYPKDPEKFLELLLQSVRNLYKANLVHGDISEYNILNFEEKPVLIDFSQCSPLRSSNAELLLNRDIKNIIRFFTKLGVKLTEDYVRDKITK